MNKKFTLTLIIAVALVSVIAFSACGFTAVAEGSAWDDMEYPYPKASVTSPGFSGYTAETDMTLEEGETLTPIDGEIASDPWLLYQTMRENQGKVSGYAQVTNTVSQIEITLTEALIVIGQGTSTVGDPITQYASWMTAQDGNGNTYSQTVSQMDRLLPGLNSIASMFGVWEKSATIDDVSYWQEGDKASRKFDETAPAGVSANWIGDVKVSEGGVTYDTSDFDYNKRVTENVAADTYRVYAGSASELGEYATPNSNGKNASNWDEVGNRVIKVQFMGSDGKWGYDTWLVWDDQEGNIDGRYVGFDRDRWYTALPSRGDGISNYLVNEETFDKVNSSVSTQTVDGHTLYVLDVKLQETENYSWDLITSGEFGSLQGGIVDFVGFSAVDSLFSKDLTLTYEIWDTGVIRRVIKQYSVESVEGAASDKSMQIDVLNGSSKAYGSATNSQIQEYAYAGSVVDISGSNAMYAFAAGGLGLFERIGVGVGVGAAVLIVLIVTLVVLAKKGVIGKKKNKKAAAEGPAEDAGVSEGDGADEESKN